MKRRQLLRYSGGVLLGTVGLFTSEAFAGSYLNRAGLLLRQGRGESDTLRAHFGDKELSRLVFRLAKARLDAAGSMLVPKEVVQAHPHLLLVFENYERAADSAQNLEPQRFLVHCQRAYDEERTFRAVLKQLGWEVAPSERDRS